MSTLTTLPNIGKEIEHKLRGIGITTVEELKKEGSKNAFVKLKMSYSNICLVHLYCLQGAIDLVDYNKLSIPMKNELKEFSDSLKDC